MHDLTLLQQCRTREQEVQLHSEKERERERERRNDVSFPFKHEHVRVTLPDKPAELAVHSKTLDDLGLRTKIRAPQILLKAMTSNRMALAVFPIKLHLLGGVTVE